MVTWLLFLAVGLPVVPSKAVCMSLVTPIWSIERRHSSRAQIQMAVKAYLKNGLQVVPGKELADAFLSYLEDRQKPAAEMSG